MRTSETESSYYPPRARWYGAFFYLMNNVRLWTRLDRITLPFPVTGQTFLLSVLMPGGSFWAAAHRVIGRGLLLTFCGCLLVFLVGIGHDFSNYAFGLMISIHVSSVVYFIARNAEEMNLIKRMVYTLLCLLALSLALYFPFRNWVLEHVATPIWVSHHLVLLRPDGSPDAIQPGDTMGYRVNASSTGEHGVYIQEGIGFEKVLALPGEHIHFTADQVIVGNRKFAREKNMPIQGEWVVPQREWFVWPHFIQRGDARNIDMALQKIAFVSWDQYIGHPYRRWFGRRQELP